AAAPSGSGSAAPTAKPSEPPAPGPRALDAPDPRIDLPLEGFLPAVAVVPVGARRPRPLLIATHGNHGSPDWTCPLFREIAGPDVFVVCPRGETRRDTPPPDVRYQYEHNTSLEREIDAGVDALARRFPEHLDASAPIYAGFSQGAIMGV